MWARAAILFAGVAFTLAACATVDPREDLRIEAEIKARLVSEKEANLSRLGVVSTKGTVYLSGTVASADEGARAEQLAREVKGVQRVVNTLDVQAAPR
jgi:osmotically-inducible protein OsmY